MCIRDRIGNVDLDYIKKEFTSFCRNQNLKNVILQSVDLLKAGNFDRIKDLVDKAMKVGTETDLGHDYKDDFLSRMEDVKRSTVPSDWSPINDLMDGGLGPGELGVVVAPSGVGKTWILTALGASAVRQGLSVVHYSLELSEHYVGQRYDTVFSKIPSANVKERKEEVKEKIKALKGKKLVFHNASFDVQFIKNYFGIDLIDDIWVDTGLLVHTVYEEGAFGFGNPFGLKSIAIMNQKELGLDVEKAANEEQIELKESIKKNGGETTKLKFEIYKADLDILSKYASADTDLTLRICNLYLEKLKEEGLEKFFFEEEVMPVYREVTIPMEACGVDLDIDLLYETHKNITEDLEKNKGIVMKSLLDTSEAKKWVMDTCLLYTSDAADE